MKLQERGIDRERPADGDAPVTLLPLNPPESSLIKKIEDLSRVAISTEEHILGNLDFMGYGVLR